MKHRSEIERQLENEAIEQASVEEAFHKWERIYEREHYFVVWLRADMDGQGKFIICVDALVCCQKYETRICGLKTSSGHGSMVPSIIRRAISPTTPIVKSAMMYLHKDQAKTKNEPHHLKSFVIANESSCEGASQEKV